MRDLSRVVLFCLVGVVSCGREKQVPLTQQTPGDRAGAIGSADPINGNGQRLVPGTKFKRASAKLETTAGSKLGGDAGFEEITSGVRVRVSIHDAKPNGKLGVHIHEKGDCSNMTAGSMGEHLNPGHTRHGLPGGEEHLGDLGNIPVDEKGNGELLILTSGGNLREDDPHTFLHRAIVIDDREDDGSADGGLGKPIACGVIKE